MGGGVLYRYKIQTGQYEALWHFSLINDGRYPAFGVQLTSQSQIIGLTQSGGTDNTGIFYKYNPANKSMVETRDLYYLGVRQPAYGFSNVGGGIFLAPTYDSASTISLIKYDESTDSLTKIVAPKNLNLKNPFGKLAFDSSSAVFGYAFSNYRPVIYRFDVVSGQFSLVDSIPDPFGVHEGPVGHLTYKNGFIYGSTIGDCPANTGTIFRINTLTNQRTTLQRFIDSIDVFLPEGSLYITSNNKLIGATSTMGAFNQGLLFEYDLLTGQTQFKVNFNNDFSGMGSGSIPFRASNGKLYFCLNNGGKGGAGTLVSYHEQSGLLTKEMDFEHSDIGGMPRTALTLHGNGNFYGFTTKGGDHGFGTIFKYDPIQKTIQKIQDLDILNRPKGYRQGFELSSDGKLYYLTYYNSLAIYDPYSNSFNDQVYKISPGSQAGYPKSEFVIASSGKAIFTDLVGDTLLQNPMLFSINPTDSTFAIENEYLLGDGPRGNLTSSSPGKFVGKQYHNGSLWIYEVDENDFDFDYLFELPLYCNFLNLSSQFPLVLNQEIWLSARSQTGDQVFYKFDQSNNEFTYYNGFETGLNWAGLEGRFFQGDGKLYGICKDTLDEDGFLFSFDTASRSFRKIFSFNSDVGTNPSGLCQTQKLLTPISNFESTQSQLGVYPNPFSNSFSIDVNEESWVEVYSINGRQISSRTYLPGKQISIEGNSGLYILIIRNSSGTYSQKIMKN